MLNPPQSLEARLESTVRQLAEIGPRNLYHLPALERAAREIEGWFTSAGCATARQAYEARGASFANIVADVPGWSRHKDVLVIGAHYDTHKNSPGANDNGSGIAALVELARSAALHCHRLICSPGARKFPSA